MRASKPNRPSLELDDYSGPFQPDLHISDFSKEGLMKLVEIGGSIYGAVNRQWYLAAIKRFGQEVADEMHHEVWFADGGAGDHENFTISKLMGFENDDDETAAIVADAFAANFAERGEVGAAVTVVHRGVTVVDLWGGWADEARTRPW